MDDWKNRRRMAWIAFCSLLAIAFYALWKGELSQGVVAVVTTICITLGGIVTAYMGFATADAHSKRKTGLLPAQPGNHQKSGDRHYETR